MALEFGIFDHVDRHDQPLSDFYEDRFRLIEAYDRASIYGYHCAEHHSTPLGMAPSPSVYLAAIGQRTRRLRFGPLVYTLALYHPLRLAEEICMLDQMSRGRFLLGIGKGISPIEVGYYGVDYKNADKMFAESFAIIMQALTKKTVDFEGEFFRYKNVPFEVQPFQKPHPPLWYGVVNPDSAERAAKAGMNFISNSTAAMVKAKVARYSAAYKATVGQPAPKFGMNRYMVLAETEDEALQVARRAYRRWWSSFMSLWHKHNIRADQRQLSAGDRRPDRRRPRHRHDAGQGAGHSARAACGIGRELSGLPLRVRRPVAVGIAALAGPVPAPRHAGTARERAGRGGITS